MKNFELPRVRIAKWFEIQEDKKTTKIIEL